jgi:hypothetical protein
VPNRQPVCSRAYDLAGSLRAFGRAVERRLNIPYYLCDDLYHLAHLYVLQGRYGEARLLNQEVLDLAAQVENREIQFQAQCLAIRLGVYEGQADTQAAIAQFEALLATWIEEGERAAIHYEIWRLDQAREEAGQMPAELYRILYERIAAVGSRRHYEELSGDRLSSRQRCR